MISYIQKESEHIAMETKKENRFCKIVIKGTAIQTDLTRGSNPLEKLLTDFHDVILSYKYGKQRCQILFKYPVSYSTVSEITSIICNAYHYLAQYTNHIVKIQKSAPKNAKIYLYLSYQYLASVNQFLLSTQSRYPDLIMGKTYYLKGDIDKTHITIFFDSSVCLSTIDKLAEALAFKYSCDVDRKDDITSHSIIHIREQSCLSY